MFKKFFNKKNQNSKLDNKEVIDLGRLYPYLMNGSNPYLSTLLKRTIVGTVEEPLLVLTFGIKEDSELTLLKPKDILGSNLEDFNRSTISNMEVTGYEVEVNLWPNGACVSNTKNSLASEFILSNKIMNEFHEKLNAQEMWVSIPTRGVIFAIDKNSNADHFKQFLIGHKKLYLESENNLMRDLLFIKNGALTGVKSLDVLFED